MRVYKFLCAKFGLKVVKEHRIKISEVTDLNDPFELIPFDLSDLLLRQVCIKTRNDLNKDKGLVCFSQSWSNQVLWSHYSDNHRGICLGFDAKDDLAKRVQYIPHRLRFPFNREPDLHVMEQMLYTKYDAWSYEQEARIWVNRMEADDGLYFAEIDDKDLTLCQVILGARCNVERSVIEEATKTYKTPVEILKARLSWTSFDVVEDQAGFAEGA